MAKRVPALMHEWFSQQGWTPFGFQKQTWAAYAAGESGLVHAPTGTGKTLAAIGGVVNEMAPRNEDPGPGGAPFTVLWITPMRALSSDTCRSIQEVVEAFDLPWRVETRTGDTKQSIKRKQPANPPTVLITTPESLEILQTHWQFIEQCATLRLVVVDEWHELLQSKRGVQTELGLARVKRFAPDARLWGLSATLGNMVVARDILLGSEDAPGRIIGGAEEKGLQIDTLRPRDITRFTWAGHLGLAMLEQVLEELETVESALIFTNTRSQAEQWYHAITHARPRWIGTIALHHGSMDREKRTWVEEHLREGKLRCVVCTSTLELGIDLPDVDRVFQVGSPKGVARLLQRAGRSGHRPGLASRVTGVPAHALELLEFAAARRAYAQEVLEPVRPIDRALDVLIQHMVSVAIGGGFVPEALYDEVRTAYSYRQLTYEAFEQALKFARGYETGLGYGSSATQSRIWLYEGKSRRLQGTYVCTEGDLITRHRMAIGTILGDAELELTYTNGHSLGTVEESFVAQLDKGDHFIFAGKSLELVRIRDMEATVRKVPHSSQAVVPRWMGGRMPLSTELSGAIRDELSHYQQHGGGNPELEHLRPLLELQATWSVLPGEDMLLIERIATRQGHHLFIYPFEGRRVHEGLGALLAGRLATLAPLTFTIAVNDYGIELLSADPAPLQQALAENVLFQQENLTDEIDARINEAEMARRQFREIARIAGLVFPGYPGRSKRLSQIQSTAGLIYDTLIAYDPDHILIEQAQREVRERTLDREQVAATLDRLAQASIEVIDLPRMSPLAFPLYIDRLRQRVSSEKLSARIAREVKRLERHATAT